MQALTVEWRVLVVTVVGGRGWPSVLLEFSL